MSSERSLNACRLLCLQMLTNCDYSSFITLSGPEEVRTELVDAANSNKLCDLLPQ